MKVIFVLCDSFRQDHLGFMGKKPIYTPRLDAFSREACVFTHAQAGSWATVPNRTDLLTGRYGFPERGWRPLKDDDVTVPTMLDERGIPSQLVSDTANTVSRENNHYRGFTAWYHLRGQEGDHWRMNDDVPFKTTCPLSMIRYPKDRWHRVLMNRAHRTAESDWFAPGTFKWASEWLEQNYRRKDFLLWIDTFDPHEPWDPPQHYTDLYDPGYKGRVFEAPSYGLRKKLDFTDRELKYTRALYAGEVSMVDHWFGRMLDTVAKLGIEDHTMIIFTADHGVYLDYPDDGGLVGKPVATQPDGFWVGRGKPGEVTYHPMYMSMLRQPLLIRVPGRKPKRTAYYAQPCDIAPTIMDFFGMKRARRHHGQSLLPVIAGRKHSPRPRAYSGIHEFMSVVSDSRWAYCCWQGQRPCALWDLKKDPDQKHNIARRHPDRVRRMHRLLREFLRSHGASEEFIAKHDPMM